MKVGRYEIPNMRLFPTLVEATRVIYDKFTSDEVTDLGTLAGLLGHKSAKSGAFLTKVAALRDYGLIEGRGSVRVSEIGKKLTYPASEAERSEALKRAIEQVPLWKELLQRYPRGLPEENFWVDLARLTGLEAPKAQAIEGQVKREYAEDVKHLVERERAPEEEREAPAAAAASLKPPEMIEELKWGDIRIWLPKHDPKAAQRAKSLIELYLKELGEASPD